MCVCDHAVTSLRFDITEISPPVSGAVSVEKGLELEKVDIISNNNTVNKRFSTYVNRQSR